MDQNVVFLDLPHALLVDLLLQWLDLLSVARLDSAACRQSHRPTLLQVLSCIVWTNNPRDKRNIQSFYAWTVARNVQLVWVTLNELVPAPIAVKVLSFNALSIRRVDLSHNTDDVSSVLADIAYYCKNLEVLKLGQSWGVGGVKAVLQRCCKLCTLHVSRATSGIDERCFEGLYCPSLKTIALSTTVNDAAVSAMVRAFPSVESLEFYMNEIITNRSVIAIASKYSNLSTVGFYKNSLITDEAMSVLYKACPGLIAVDVGKCTRLTDASFVDLATHCANLRRLCLRINPLISNVSLVAIANSCKSLALLSCEGCRRITNSGIVAIATHCPRMKVFHFGKHKYVTGAAVLSVAENCKHLKEMGILDVDVSAELVVRVAGLCGSRLKQLHFIKCRGIDEPMQQAAVMVMEEYPRLRVNLQAGEFRTNIVTSCTVGE